MWTCASCEEEVEDQFDVCWNCGTEKDGSLPDEPSRYAAMPRDERVVRSDSDPTERVAEVLLDRYDGAYTAAESLIALGRFVKAVAIFIGGLAVFGGLVSLAADILPQSIGLAGATIGAAVGFGFYLVGAGLVAGGQLLVAILDIAVNTSPFLSKQDQLEIFDIES